MKSLYGTDLTLLLILNVRKKTLSEEVIFN
jgi:hypothetical protein